MSSDSIIYQVKTFRKSPDTVELAEKINSIRNIQDGYRELAVFNTEIGRFKEAYLAFEKFKVAEDSIKNYFHLNFHSNDFNQIIEFFYCPRLARIEGI
ncbi:MAG: hypothetical protein NXI20_04525 [bacterium]|nr:hypothetical protein [bacterium]